MHVIKLPTVPGDWVVEAEMGQVGQKRRDVNLLFHITQAVSGGPWGTLSTQRTLLELAWSPLSREFSPKPALLCPIRDSGLRAKEKL